MRCSVIEAWCGALLALFPSSSMNTFVCANLILISTFATDLSHGLEAALRVAQRTIFEVLELYGAREDIWQTPILITKTGRFSLKF